MTLSINVIHWPTVNLTRTSTVSNVFVVQATMETVSIVSKLRPTALKKTFVTFMLTAFITQFCVEVRAYVKKDTKEQVKAVTWLLNVKHQPTVAIIPSATKEYVNATRDMNETVQTCKLIKQFFKEISSCKFKTI